MRSSADRMFDLASHHDAVRPQQESCLMPVQHATDALLVAVLIVAAISDLRSGRIYNWLVYPATILGLVLGAVSGAAGADRVGGSIATGLWNGLADHALAAAIGFAVMFFCYAIGGMGGGDVKLMAAVGALGGLNRGEGDLFIVYAIFYSFAMGVAMGIVGALWRGVLGTTVRQTWWALRLLAVPGTNLAEAAPAKPSLRVPLGFATAAGTVWLLVENYAGVSLGQIVFRLL